MMPRLLSLIGRALGTVRWYLNGVLEGDAYQKYVQHMALAHPGRRVMGEREFWRDRTDYEERHPQGRCC